MAIWTVTSSERPINDPEEAARYGPCCGQLPEVRFFKRKRLTNVVCRNPECENAGNGVLCYQGDSEGKWERLRVSAPSDTVQEDAA